MNSRKIKAALFDLDGTLLDTEGQYSIFYGGIGKRFHPEIPDFADRIKGTTLTQMCASYFPDSEQAAQLIKELNEFEANMDYILYPGAMDFLLDLKRHGIKCAIVTASNRIKMEQVAKSIPGFSDIFDRVLTSEDYKVSKPDPACYLMGAEVFGLATNECMVFEDAFNGLAAGMASGIFTFGLATTNSKDAIADKCDCVLESWLGLTTEACCELIR